MQDLDTPIAFQIIQNLLPVTLFRSIWGIPPRCFQESFDSGHIVSSQDNSAATGFGIYLAILHPFVKNLVGARLVGRFIYNPKYSHHSSNNNEN
jgi:hypothetical protein